MPTLFVPNFGGGVVLTGSPDAQSTSELQACDSFDIGPRGQLATCRSLSSYGEVLKDTNGNPVVQVYGMAVAAFAQDTQCLAVSGGFTSLFAPCYDVHSFPPGFVTNGVGTFLGQVGTTRHARGGILTTAAFPYVSDTGVQERPLFLNVGARLPDQPRTAPGLYVVGYAAGVNPILNYDALGTGLLGQFPGGTHSKQLYFRGIAGYNNHLFGWGFDQSDATNGDGPSRLMFSNLGNPYMWGNDNVAAVGTDRDFADTDAITVGTAGEVIMAALASQGKLWIGTNRGLHYLSGYGRDSFKTDGTTGVASSLDVIGANAMLEGPDGMLYGVSSRGLWRLNGGAVEHLYRALVKFDGTSPGFWDLIWTTPGASAGYPGSTNADLVWMYSDVTNNQVCIVIPFTNFDGSGNGTVVIKYHTETGGFTRYLFSPNGLSLTAGATFKRTPISAAVTVFGDSGSGNGLTVRQYPPLAPGSTATGGGPVAFGPYSPFGPDGSGVNRICYLTVSWASAGLPITGTLTPTVDQQTLTLVNFRIATTAPGGPSDGDVWVDTSATDTNLGNHTAGAIIPASNDYLVKRWIAGWAKWVIVSRSDGMQGNRCVIPIAYTPTRGNKLTFTVSLSAGDYAQIEGLGMSPATIRSAV